MAALKFALTAVARANISGGGLPSGSAASRASPLILFSAGAGLAGATGESRLAPGVIFCSAAAAAENLFHAGEDARAAQGE